MRPIAISLSPNLLFKDALIALSYLVLPWKWFSWQEGKFVFQTEKKLSQILKIPDIYTFDSGRSALYAVLRCLNLEPGAEVLLQGYTCIVVSNSVIWAHLKPVYVDIEAATLNMDSQDLEKKITGKSKVVIVQHTFGKPANLRAILKIAQKHHLIVIEDCAHALGATYHGQAVGTFGQAAIFSFGRDKVVSAVHGGAAGVNDAHLAEKIKNYRDALPLVSRFRIFQHLTHAALFYFFILPFYNILGIGKIILVLAQKIGLISKVFVRGEKRAVMPKFFPTQFPNALAAIASHQLQYLSRFNQHRMDLAKYYRQELAGLSIQHPREENKEQGIYMRYTIQTDQAEKLMKAAKKERVLLGDWYDTVIAPRTVREVDAQYQPGDCPVAEKVALKTVNLPTYYRIGEGERKKIVSIVKAVCK
jgi:dTDP-4-amino-4,6-dideoxygalactose transaminase